MEEETWLDDGNRIEAKATTSKKGWNDYIELVSGGNFLIHFHHC